MGLITVGLAEIKVGAAASSPRLFRRLVVYVFSRWFDKRFNTSTPQQLNRPEASEVTEHFEEGHAAPVYSKRTKKIPKSTFQLCDVDPDMLAKYVGGTVNSGTWEFNGNELTANVALEIIPEQGMIFQIPNASVEAVINSDMSSKGIFLVDFTVTPLAVDTGGAIRAKKKD